MIELLSVETIAVTVLGYPLSYVELFGTLATLWSVWLIAHGRILTWPVGIVGVLLYLALFYQIRLYSDVFEQAYYLVLSVYGWWLWSTSGPAPDEAFQARYSTPRGIALGVVVTAVLSAAAGVLVSRLHLLWPGLFPEPASFPYLDALTTMMSFTAQALMTWKRTESWLYWIAVDVIGIGLYAAKGVYFVTLLYVVLLGLATHGFLRWSRELHAEGGLRPGQAGSSLARGGRA